MGRVWSTLRVAFKQVASLIDAKDLRRLLGAGERKASRALEKLVETALRGVVSVAAVSRFPVADLNELRTFLIVLPVARNGIAIEGELLTIETFGSSLAAAEGAAIAFVLVEILLVASFMREQLRQRGLPSSDEDVARLMAQGYLRTRPSESAPVFRALAEFSVNRTLGAFVPIAGAYRQARSIWTAMDRMLAGLETQEHGRVESS